MADSPQTPPLSAEKKKRRLGLTGQILISIALGIGCGLFFGESCDWLKVPGDAFIGLLQMTILPYIVVALISSIGRLRIGQGRRLAMVVGVVMAALWTVGITVVMLMPQAFPARTSASFFTTRLTEAPRSLNFVELFIPSNPFYSLANNLVPAIVVFSVCLGAALVRMPHKEKLLGILDVVGEALNRINSFVVKATPVGVFAMVAAAAGTMTPEDLGKLKAYLLCYTAAILILTMLVLPLLITACTSFRYRDVLSISATAMVTAFATAKLIVVIPMLIERTKELLAEEAHRGTDDPAPMVEAIYPLAYAFPNLGKLATLLFVPFVAWFIGAPMEAGDYPGFVSMGLVTYFGKPIVAMPFLLDHLRLPADMFQWFMISDIYGGRIGDVLAVIHLVAITLLSTSWMIGTFRMRWRRLFVGIAGSVAVLFALISGTNVWLQSMFADEPDKKEILAQMQSLVNPSPSVVHRRMPPPRPQDERELPAMQRIRRSGVLRVGFIENNYPYTFFNADDELVGYDADMAHRLAQDLECRLEFVPVSLGSMAQALDQAECDLVMSGIPVTSTRLANLRCSASYLDVTFALIARDYRRRELDDLEEVREAQLRIGISPDGYFRRLVKRELPNAELVPLEETADFFEDDSLELDAMLIDAEGGSAWTLLYPGYQVVVPEGLSAKQPLAYPMSRESEALSTFVSGWIDLVQKRGLSQQLYDHWILGKNLTATRPRWNVLRDVLGWDE